MSNLFILNETFTNGINYNLLNVLSFMSILSAVLVIISKNPIVSVLFLIGLFLNVAGYLMLIGINFIGLSYLLVYVGAVSILFLFILMLINVRVSELLTDNNNSVPLGIIISVFFNIVLYNALLVNKTVYNYYPYIKDKSIISNSNVINYISYYGVTGNNTNMGYDTFNVNQQINDFVILPKNIGLINNNDLSFISSQIWDGALAEVSHITSIGNIIYSVYAIWLVIASFILLLAMVGAIVITLKPY